MDLFHSVDAGIGRIDFSSSLLEKHAQSLCHVIEPSRQQEEGATNQLAEQRLQIVPGNDTVHYVEDNFFGPLRRNIAQIVQEPYSFYWDQEKDLQKKIQLFEQEKENMQKFYAMEMEKNPIYDVLFREERSLSLMRDFLKAIPCLVIDFIKLPSLTEQNFLTTCLNLFKETFEEEEFFKTRTCYQNDLKVLQKPKYEGGFYIRSSQSLQIFNDFYENIGNIQEIPGLWNDLVTIMGNVRRRCDSFTTGKCYESDRDQYNEQLKVLLTIRGLNEASIENIIRIVM